MHCGGDADNSNGGETTIEEFRKLSREMQQEVVDFIENLEMFEELTVGDREYLLVHASFRNNHHIAIDCGSNRPDGRLAAICLDTGEEWYEERV